MARAIRLMRTIDQHKEAHEARALVDIRLMILGLSDKMQRGIRILMKIVSHGLFPFSGGNQRPKGQRFFEEIREGAIAADSQGLRDHLAMVASVVEQGSAAHMIIEDVIAELRFLTGNAAAGVIQRGMELVSDALLPAGRVVLQSSDQSVVVVPSQGDSGERVTLEANPNVL